MEYKVTWMIDIEADSPESAARMALEIQRDYESLATEFIVTDEKDHSTVVDVGSMSDHVVD